jgi:hypothetical protein
MSRWILSGSLVLSVLLFAGIGILSLTRNRLLAEREGLRAELATLEARHAATQSNLDQAKSEIVILRAQAAEAQSLRAELAQLQRATMPPQGKGAKSPPAGRGERGSPLSALSRRVTLGDLPAEVRAAITSKAGALDVKELAVVTEDGQLTR